MSIVVGCYHWYDGKCTKCGAGAVTRTGKILTGPKLQVMCVFCGGTITLEKKCHLCELEVVKQ